jgi:hypothetical protein
MKRLALGIGLALACVTASAGVIDAAQRAEQAAQVQDWSAWGGSVGVRWNRALLADYGIAVQAVEGRRPAPDARPHEWFELRQGGGLAFRVANGALRSFTGGTLQSRGGFQIQLADGSRIDLRNFSLRVRDGDPRVLDVLGADGKAWFYIDHLMFELERGDTRLAIKAADLRIAPALAARIGHADIAGYAVADVVVDSEVFVQGGDEAPNRSCSPYPWPGVDVPGVAGAKYQADLFMQSVSPQYMRCQGCSSTSTNGKVMFAPSSTLKNNVNDGTVETTIAGDPLGKSQALYTANVAWNTMFSGNVPPYNNDQHPFLIWNLYRVDANGHISQIGRSGVKHAWLTTNGGCLDSCYDSHKLGRGCSDTYSTGNNDASYDIGPRSEIVPAKGLWGRCGSKWDPNCTGSGDHYDNGNGDWDDRMLVSESQMGDARPGATYLFESWYIARDDVNIYNSMATLNVNPRKSGSAWTMSGASGYKLGGAIDRWVDPANPPANAKNTELAAKEGHAKVAVKVTALDGGRWRYDYAVMNFDFAREVTEGAEPGHLHVVSNRGFDRFSVPMPAGVQVLGPAADTGDANPNVTWRAQVKDGRVTWSNDPSIPGVVSSAYPMPPSLPTLDWGTLYSFSFIATSAPVNGNASLHVAQAGAPAAYDVATLVPGPAASKAR